MPDKTVTELVGELSVETRRLAEGLHRQIRRGRRLLYLTVGGLVLVLLLSAVSFYLFIEVRDSSRQVEKTSAEALCPLYDLFLDSYNPASPTAQKDPAAYDANFVVIENGAAALGCAHTKRGRG